MQAVRPFDVTFPMVLGIAVPMTLAFLSTPLIGITDTAVIGQLGDAALIGAVALGAIMFDFVGTTFNFLRAGTTGVAAQAMGAGDEEAEAITLWRALIFAAVGGVLVIALQGPYVALYLAAMAPSERVAEATREYYAVRVWGAPLMFANYAILGWLLGLARTGASLALTILLGGSNIAGSILLGLTFGYGIAGVAAASVAAEAVTLAAGAVVVNRLLASRPRPTLAAVLERAGFAKMVAMNGDILVRSMVLIFIFSFFSAISARFGDVTLAANAILINLFMLSAYFLDGLANAAEQLGGRAVGGRWRPAFDRTVRYTLVTGVLVSGALTAAAFLLAVPFVNLMTTAADVRAESLRYFAWAAVTPLAGVLAFIMDGIFIGATWSAAMRNMMLLSAALFLVVWWIATPLMGNHGLWLAIIVFLGARGVTLWLAIPARAAATFGAAAAGPQRA